MSLKILSPEDAKETILKRVPPDEFVVTDSLLDGIERIFSERLHPSDAVKKIISDVQEKGDEALRHWTEAIDGIDLETLFADENDIRQAYKDTPSDIRFALEFSARRIEAFHQKQPVVSWLEPSDEGTLGQLLRPIDRVGVYVPGGSAPLPSSLLMAVIPARVAGVKELVVCTPPGRDGSIPDVILASARIAGIDRVYKLGGAQAIAGMAYGTETVPKVDKIVGPGNIFVTLAKREVFGTVGIDGLLGPTETMIIADKTANPDLIASDMLAQAEHDPLASAILLTSSQKIAEAVVKCIDTQLNELPRKGIAAAALNHRGGIILIKNLDEAFSITNAYAPEHLQLSIEKPQEYLDKIQHAGAVFLGENSYEVLGDYVAGPSHSLPTSATARFSSGINVLTFVKLTAVIGLNDATARELSQPASIIAESEDLIGHARSAQRRIDA